MTPSPLTCAILALAAYRTYRLLARDSFPPLVWLRNRAIGAEYGAGEPPYFARPLLADWLACAWCSGLWFAADWYVSWLLWPHPTLYAAVPLALSAAVGLLQSYTPD